MKVWVLIAKQIVEVHFASNCKVKLNCHRGLLETPIIDWFLAQLWLRIIYLENKSNNAREREKERNEGEKKVTCIVSWYKVRSYKQKCVSRREALAVISSNFCRCERERVRIKGSEAKEVSRVISYSVHGRSQSRTACGHRRNPKRRKKSKPRPDINFRRRMLP